MHPGPGRHCGKQHDALAALGICLRGGGMLARRRGTVGDLLHRFQRHHFPGDLGETFDPPENAHKTVGINLDHVTGAVPARWRRLELDQDYQKGNSPASRLGRVR